MRGGRRGPLGERLPDGGVFAVMRVEQVARDAQVCRGDFLQGVGEREGAHVEPHGAHGVGQHEREKVLSALAVPGDGDDCMH